MTSPSPTKRKADMGLVKTPYPNLIRYKPSGNYFGRVRVNGKLIRRSLETHVLTVAKLKLSGFVWHGLTIPRRHGKAVFLCVARSGLDMVNGLARGTPEYL
jgi:hypothetical protein